jgi:hypothetical protein
MDRNLVKNSTSIRLLKIYLILRLSLIPTCIQQQFIFLYENMVVIKSLVFFLHLFMEKYQSEERNFWLHSPPLFVLVTTRNPLFFFVLPLFFRYRQLALVGVFYSHLGKELLFTRLSLLFGAGLTPRMIISCQHQRLAKDL